MLFYPKYTAVTIQEHFKSKNGKKITMLDFRRDNVAMIYTKQSLVFFYNNVCMYVRMYVCTYVYMYLCMYICTYVCMCA